MISLDFAELLGLHAGDGTIYKTGRGLVWELRGNLDEAPFYDTYIVPLLKRIFDFPFESKKRTGGKNGCYGVRCCKKEFIELILDAGFPVGTKTRTVEIPKSILNGLPEMKAAFLRGLFAADGCAYVEKRKTNPHKYPKIEFASASFKIVEQVQLLLREFGIESYHWDYQPKIGGPARFLRISGNKRCRRFINDIGLSNPKHLARISYILQVDKNI